MSKQKVTLRIEEGEIELLKVKFNTDNQSEAIRLAIMQSLATGDLESVKALFPYIGKKSPRIGREVVEAFKKSGCEIFVDLFCGSIKEKYESLESGFSIYDICGNLVISYKYLGDSFVFREESIVNIKGVIISADYEEEKRMIIVLKEFKETRSLLIYDEQGSLIVEIVSPQGYIFVSLKNQDGNLMVVAQGENDMTRDCFGRNDWNFAINFENLYVEKKSVIQ